MPSRIPSLTDTAYVTCNIAREDGAVCGLALTHTGPHIFVHPSGEGMRMLFPDPRLRAPTAVVSRGGAYSFLIEALVDKRWCPDEASRRPGREFMVQQIAAMCDEDGKQDNLVLVVAGQTFDFDRRYLMRIWPGLWKLPVPIQVGTGEKLEVLTEAQAIVVLVGAAIR